MTRMEGIRDNAKRLLETRPDSPEEAALTIMLKQRLTRAYLGTGDPSEHDLAIRALISNPTPWKKPLERKPHDGQGLATV